MRRKKKNRKPTNNHHPSQIKTAKTKKMIKNKI